MALTIELTAVRGADGADVPGTRTWFTGLVDGVYSYETPQLDGDLVGTEPIQALFKIPYDDEGSYKTTLALICGVSAATPGWTWSVGLDIEGSGQSFFGPTNVSFANGERVGDTDAFLAYVGRARLKKWSNLAPPIPPTPTPPPDAALWLELTGPHAKKARATAKQRMFDVVWPEAPPRPATNGFALPVHSRRSAVLLVGLAQSVTKDHDVTATVGSRVGIFDDYGLVQPIHNGALDGDCAQLRQEVRTASRGLRGVPKPEPVEHSPFEFMGRFTELEHVIQQGGRAWLLDGIVVAAETQGGIALEHVGIFADSLRVDPSPAGRVTAFPDSPGTALHVRARIERTRERLVELDSVDRSGGWTRAVQDSCRAMLTGNAPPIDLKLARALERWHPRPLLSRVATQLRRLIPKEVSQALVAENKTREAKRIANRSLVTVLRSVNAGKEDASSLDRFPDDDIIATAFAKPSYASKLACDAVEQRVTKVVLTEHTHAALTGWNTLKKTSSLPSWMACFVQLPQLHTQWAIDVCQRSDRKHLAVSQLLTLSTERAHATLLEWCIRHGKFLERADVEVIRQHVPTAKQPLGRLMKEGRVKPDVKAQLEALTAPHRAFLEACRRYNSPAEVAERLANPPKSIQQRVREAVATILQREIAELPKSPIRVTMPTATAATDLFHQMALPGQITDDTVVFEPDSTGPELAIHQAQITRAAVELTTELVVIHGPAYPTQVRFLDGRAVFTDNLRHDSAGHRAVLRSWDHLLGLGTGPLATSNTSRAWAKEQTAVDTRHLSLPDTEQQAFAARCAQLLRAEESVSLGAAGCLIKVKGRPRWRVDEGAVELPDDVSDTLGRILAHLQAGFGLEVSGFGTFTPVAAPGPRWVSLILDDAFVTAVQEALD